MLRSNDHRMVLKRRASWLRSSTLRISDLRGVSISTPPQQQLTRRCFIGDQDIAVHQLDGAKDGLNFLVAARGNDAQRHAAQLLKRNGHHALVDRMVNERSGV